MFQKNFFQNKNSKNLKDLFMFGRVLSTGIVIAGYAFLGVWLSNKMLINGWNKFLAFSVIPVVTGFGMWQGWLFITKSNSRKKS